MSEGLEREAFEVGGRLAVYLETAEAYASSLRQKLEQAERNLETFCIVEIAARNPSVADYCKHWETRAEQAERERDGLKEELRAIRNSK